MLTVSDLTSEILSYVSATSAFRAFMRRNCIGMVLGFAAETLSIQQEICLCLLTYNQKSDGHMMGKI